MLEATHGKDSKKSGPGKSPVSPPLNLPRALFIASSSTHTQPSTGIIDEAVHCCLIRTAPDELPAFVAEHNGLRDTRWTPTGDTVTATLLQRAAECKDALLVQLS